MSVTCQHGGTCVDSCWNPQMFTCECRKDYEGVFCEKHSGGKEYQIYYTNLLTYTHQIGKDIQFPNWIWSPIREI